MRDGALPLAERAVRTALQAGAQAAEAFALREAGWSASVEKNELASAEWTEQAGLGVRVYREDRLGFAYGTDAGRLPALVEEAFKAGRLGKRLPRFRFPAPRRPPKVEGLFDRRLLDVSDEDLVAQAVSLVDAVHEVRADLNVASAGASAGWSETAVANSEGVAATARETGTSAHVFVVQSREGVSTGFASRESTRRDVDANAVGRQAGDLALATMRPQKLDRGGRLACLVKPEPASDLFSTITLSSLEARPAHRGESYYSGKRGRRVANPKISLVEDPLAPGGLGSAPFDDEGAPSRRLRPIQRGVLTTFYYDAATAREYRGRLTSSAVRSHPLEGRSYKAPPSAGARQVRFEAPHRPTEKLVEGIDHGVLLHDLMGVHTANTISGDFSVTSSVLFLIQDGAIAHPLAPVGVAGNLHQELRRGFRLGDDVKRMGGDAPMDLPSVLFEGFTVTP